MYALSVFPPCRPLHPADAPGHVPLHPETKGCIRFDVVAEKSNRVAQAFPAWIVNARFRSKAVTLEAESFWQHVSNSSVRSFQFGEQHLSREQRAAVRDKLVALTRNNTSELLAGLRAFWDEQFWSKIELQPAIAEEVKQLSVLINFSRHQLAARGLQWFCLPFLAHAASGICDCCRRSRSDVAKA